MDAPEASIHTESINSTRPMENRPADVICGSKVLHVYC